MLRTNDCKREYVLNSRGWLGPWIVESCMRCSKSIMTHLVGSCMVSVVLVRPPCGAHAAAEFSEGPHEHVKLASAVSVVMREPSCDGVGNAEDNYGGELHRKRSVELCQHDA